MAPHAPSPEPRLDGPKPAEPSPEPSAGTSRRPFRRPVGGDFFLTTFPDDAERLWLDAGFPVDGWHTRPVQRPNRPAFPGTSLRLDLPGTVPSRHAGWWEIVAARRQSNATGGERFIYELRPWQGHIVRVGVELSADSARRLTAEHRAAARRRTAADRTALFMPFYGLMPADEQQEIESRHGLPPGRATILTASLLLLLASYGVLLSLAASFGLGGDDTSLAHDLRFLLTYLVLESLLRLSVGAGGEPMGSALVVVPLAALRALRPTLRDDEQLPFAPAPTPPDAEAWLSATDRVETLPPADDDRARLAVLSPLPKDHWRAEVDIIRHRGTTWTLVDRQEVPGGHRFVLEEPPPGMRTTRAVHDYEVTEVREIYKEKRRLTAEAWLETLTPLVGLTEPALQLELAEFTTYRPYRGVLHSILFAFLFGLLAAQAGWMNLTTPRPADHLVLLALGIVMVWENAVRGVRLYRGEITPSFLGRLVSPFARRALRWRPDPSWPYPPTTGPA